MFAEDVATGRVVAGNVTLPSGDYRIDALEPGKYRLISQVVDGPVTADEIASATGVYSGLFETTPPFETTIATRRSSRVISVGADASTSVGFFVPTNGEPSVKPRLIGMNGELSNMALPLRPGKTITIYIAGEGIDQIPGAGLATSSPFIVVNPETVADEAFDVPYPTISFQITIAPNTPAGDYSLVLQSSDGEPIYIVGALTIDPIN